MKKEYDFSNAVPNRHAASIPRGAVFVKFGPAVSALFAADGSLEDRLRRAGSKRRGNHRVRVIVLSKSEFAPLRALIEQLGGEIMNAPKKSSRRAAG